MFESFEGHFSQIIYSTRAAAEEDKSMTNDPPQLTNVSLMPQCRPPS